MRILLKNQQSLRKNSSFLPRQLPFFKEKARITIGPGRVGGVPKSQKIKRKIGVFPLKLDYHL